MCKYTYGRIFQTQCLVEDTKCCDVLYASQKHGIFAPPDDVLGGPGPCLHEGMTDLGNQACGGCPDELPKQSSFRCCLAAVFGKSSTDSDCITPFQ